MVVFDDVMLFWLLCCVGVWNKRRVIVALLVGTLALVIFEIARLVPSRLICFFRYCYVIVCFSPSVVSCTCLLCCP